MRVLPLLFWLSLVAILTGTPARQVEAAADLARSMGAALDDDASLGEIDGGVGDDSLEAVETHASGFDLALDLGSPAHPLLDLFALIWLPTPDESAPTPLISAWPPDPSARRQAWLQRFRF